MAVDLKSLKSIPLTKLLVYAAMLIVPATLSYCKASDETDSARSASRRETEATYKTLVESVRHLEMVVTAQQETLGLLVRANGVDWSGMRMSGSGAGSAAAGSAAELGPMAAVVPAPVDFPALPDTAHEAVQMQEAK
jgi:hypothetical protein